MTLALWTCLTFKALVLYYTRMLAIILRIADAERFSPMYLFV